MKVGYLRISTSEQNFARQETIMKDYFKVEKIFKDIGSRKDTNRTELKEMLSFVREGDIIYIESISRLAGNTLDFLKIIENLKSKNVDLVSHKENIDTSNAYGKFMLTVFAGLSELEREAIKERQKEGIIEGKKRGVYKGKQAKRICNSLFSFVLNEVENKRINVSRAMEILDIKSRKNYYDRRNNFLSSGDNNLRNKA